MRICIEKKDGKSIDISLLREIAPSVRLDEKFPDGSIDIEVDDREVDAVEDKIDRLGHDYKII